MEKIGCVLGIIIFMFVTLLIMTTDIGTVEHTVRFSSQNLALHAQEETVPANVKTPVKSTTPKVTNKTISYGSANFEMETKELYNNGINLNNKDTAYKNTTGELKQSGHLNNQGTVKYSGLTGNKKAVNINSTDIKHLKTGLKPSARIKDKPAEYNNQSLPSEQYMARVNDNEYTLKNIDWRVWRSNFVNQITDDTFYIPELNKYPTGTMFHYYFTVDNTGRVYNVKVTSLNISREDREKIAELIRGYSYTNITKFPENSKRKTATVSAILLFSNETEYSSPSDFHDLEQVKIKL